MPQFDVMTFGETMLRLSPPGFGRIEMADSFEVRVGGSESNTAVALAQLGRKVSWWSKLVDDPLGRRICQDIRRWGVDVSNVIWTPTGRTGLYFVEFGARPRPHHVHYDRAGSAASTLEPNEIDWSLIEASRHLHLTGITPALSEGCAKAVRTAAKEARKRSLSVSFDVNYRRKLWPPDHARSVLSEIILDADLLLCPVADAEEVFGLTGSAEQIAREFQQRFSTQNVVVTAGKDGSIALEGEVVHKADALESFEVDRVGGGDAFDAGVIDGYLDGELERGLRFGVAMAAIKYTIPGDQLIATRAEIEAIASGVPARIVR